MVVIGNNTLSDKFKEAILAIYDGNVSLSKSFIAFFSNMSAIIAIIHPKSDVVLTHWDMIFCPVSGYEVVVADRQSALFRLLSGGYGDCHVHLALRNDDHAEMGRDHTLHPLHV